MYFHHLVTVKDTDTQVIFNDLIGKLEQTDKKGKLVETVWKMSPHFSLILSHKLPSSIESNRSFSYIESNLSVSLIESNLYFSNI